ncbi:MAG: hypothetical protein M9962_08825 [Oligoflexia bacterium]|nr:hypothetical protein [Oligoflexia bacterium]
MSNKTKHTMGIFCYGSHDSAIACISPSGEIIYCAEEERFDRIKHSSSFPINAIETLFTQHNLSWNDIDQVGFAWDPFLDITKVGLFVAKQFFHSKRFLFQKKQKTPSRIEKWKHIYLAKKKLYSLGFRGELHHISHHLCHAASAYFSSGFEQASCLTVDGNGEFATTTIHHFTKSGHTQLWRALYPHSLGHFYATITQYLGFSPMNDEYKVMGLSSYEKALPKTNENPLDRVLLLNKDGSFRLNLDYFLFHKGSDKMWSPELENLLGPARKKEDPIERKHEQIAFYAQSILENALLGLVKKTKLLEPTETNLAIAGGVGLNCVANQLIFKSKIFKNVFFQPAAHDSGTALGAAQLLWHKTHKANAATPKTYALGPKYQPTPSQIQDAELLSDQNLIEKVCSLLLEQKIVAWYNGPMEFGPRALGHRSLLALPQDKSIRNKMNLIIKKRESFRPFAPVVIEDDAERFFVMDHKPSPYMMRTVDIRPEHIQKLQAIAHVDGTARVQTVNKEQNEHLYKLLKKVEEKTSYPILLNTSLNRNHEPIACNPDEAIAIFRETDVDALILENYLFIK